MSAQHEEPDNIDCLYTTEITCPYCGHETINSWEKADDDDYECSECEKTFKYERSVEVTYCSYKMETIS